MASALRKWMRSEDIYDKDIESILTEFGVGNPPSDFKNITQKQWDEIVRRGTVERFKELKDQASRNRLEKKMKKLEKVWRKESGIKSTSIKSTTKKKKDDTNESSKKQKKALESNQNLKKFMQKNGIWEMELFMILTDLGCDDGNDLKSKINTNDEFDEVYRKVRVARAKDLKDNDSKLRMEKLMTKFEKIWREQSGIKKTAITSKTNKEKSKKTPKDAKNDELSGKGLILKKWMQKNAIWEKDLYEELLKNNVDNPEKLGKLNEEEFDNIVRTVRVEKVKELKDQNARNRVDALLTKFEKKWRKDSGIKKTSIKD